MDDKYSTTRNELLDQMAYAMGGRAAEEIVFRDPSTGASNDIQKATDTARKMVTQYGMSARVGSIKLGGDSSEPFLGRDAAGSGREYSERTAAIVDEEVRALLEQAHDEAYEILLDNRHVLDRLALELLERETLNEAQIADIFRDVRKRDLRPVWLSKDTRPVPDVPPVVTQAEREEARRLHAQDPSTLAPQDQAVAAKPEHPVEVPERGHSVSPGDASGSTTATD
jgi:cell division protease FtsH